MKRSLLQLLAFYGVAVIQISYLLLVEGYHAALGWTLIDLLALGVIGPIWSIGPGRNVEKMLTYSLFVLAGFGFVFVHVAVTGIESRARTNDEVFDIGIFLYLAVLVIVCASGILGLLLQAAHLIVSEAREQKRKKQSGSDPS